VDENKVLRKLNNLILIEMNSWCSNWYVLCVKLHWLSFCSYEWKWHVVI